MLKKFDSPLIASGTEWLYTDKTQFVRVAKKDGEVVHCDNKIIIVRYDDGEVDIFDISYRKIYVENMDFLKVYAKPGDKIKRGDILAESNYCQNGKTTIGKNLLTGVMVYYGNNYEDGIVISDRLAEQDVLTSVHFRDLSFTVPPHKVLLSLKEGIYKPLPDELDIINVGEPYAILKTMNSEDLYSVFNEPMELQAEKKFLISEVNLFVNDYCKDIPEYKQWVESKISEQRERENFIQKIIRDNLPKQEADRFIKEKGLDVFSFVGKYKEKKEAINGIKVDLYGVHFRKIRVGDKIGNRHGNKGVISRIVPHEKMPRLEDGRHLDICINPLGIISRMNIGQLYELHLSMSVNDLKKTMIGMIDAELPSEEIKSYLMDYINIIDNTKVNWYSQQMDSTIPNEITREWIEEKLQIIQPPMESIKIEQLIQALEYTATSFKQKIYDPVSKNYILNPVAVGYMYFFRMVHIAEEKLAARGIGVYAKRTLQPLGGRRNKGGQRCGEMETACIIGHDAPINLSEFFTTKSDCTEMKNAYIRNLIEPELVDESKDLDTTPESVKLLNAYLTVIGVDLK
jgi:DNA-directed RNA polymerase subunit beta